MSDLEQQTPTGGNNSSGGNDVYPLMLSPGDSVPVSGIYRAMPQKGSSFAVTLLKDATFPAMKDGSVLSYRLIHPADDARQHQLLI